MLCYAAPNRTNDGVEEAHEGEEGDEAGRDVEDQHDRGRGSLGRGIEHVGLFPLFDLDLVNGSPVIGRISFLRILYPMLYTFTCLYLHRHSFKINCSHRWCQIHDCFQF